MEIDVRTEDDEGNILFEGVLKKQEVSFVLSVGINYLLSKGAFPFMTKETEEEVIPVVGNDTVQ